MKNKEKYLDEIIEAVLNDDLCEFVDKHCKHVIGCKNVTDCAKCRKELMAWLEEEYNPKPRLSYDEYVILKNTNIWYGWIARNDNDDLCIYASKPIKHTYRWYEQCGTLVFAGYNHLFQFVKWEDEEPTSIKELLDEYEKYHNDN